MLIITDAISLEQLRPLLGTFFNLVKAVVDVDREILAVDADMHSDLEKLLLDDGSRQENLWGINLYPDQQGEDMVEFDSMINIRPTHGNRSRGVDSEDTRKQILNVVHKRIK